MRAKVGLRPQAVLRRLQDLTVAGRRVLVRVDFNVPLKDGAVLDDGRIRAALPTINFLLEKGAVVTLASHLGRPKGPDPLLRLAPVAQRLGQLLGRPVRALDVCIGEGVSQVLASAAPGEVFLLENLRFHAGEKQNDPTFAQALAAPFEAFVQDAFGALHRAHASTHSIASLLPSAAGLLVQREVAALERLVKNPAHPYLAVIGGKKAEEKIGGLLGLLANVDAFLIGGGVAFTFLVTKRLKVGNSIVATDWVDEARRFVEAAYHKGATVVLPRDVQLTQKLENNPEAVIALAEKIPDGWMGVDIGPQTSRDFQRRLRRAKTVFWAGPLGAFEYPPFDRGTVEVARCLADCQATVVVGGGETGAAFARAGIESDNVFVSTGGGASLEYAAGMRLPGLEALAA